MIKAVFCSDTHLGFDYPVRARVSKERRGENFFSSFRTVLDYAKETSADLLIHGGDLFFRSKIPLQIVDKVYEMILEFLESGIKFVIVPGNHERSRLPDSFLLAHPDFFIFSQPDIFRFEKDKQKINIHGFPYTADIRNNFTAVLSETGDISKDATNIILFHQLIESSGIKGHTFRKGNDIIPLNLLPDSFSVVLAGHIHLQQVLFKRNISSSIPIIYSGSTERTSYQEADEEKGFYTLAFSPSGIQYRFVKLETKNLPVRNSI